MAGRLHREGIYNRMHSQALSAPASSRPTAIFLPKLALAVSLAVIGLVVPATPAMAADSAAVAFADAFNGAGDGATVSLAEDVTIETADDLPLTVSSGEAITLDLNGHSLNVSALTSAAIGVPSGAALTIIDSSDPSTGALVATSLPNTAAGIGGYSGDAGDGDAGIITIDSGEVTATGGYFSAGIGGGNGGAGGAVIINGGTVTATGDSEGAGIGGGSNGDAATVTINGGTVAAHGLSGAGIGGGKSAAGGAVTVNGGSVTATSSNGSGIGSGAPGFFGDPLAGGTLATDSSAVVTVAGRDAQALGSHTDLGTVTNSGSLTLPEGESIDLKDGTLSNSGTVNNAGTILGTGVIEGQGTVVNTGSITHPISIDGAQTVTDHHYSLSFDANGGETVWGATTPWSIVDGPTLQSVERTTADFPTASRSGYTFDGWYSNVDGTATLVTDTTPLPGSSADGTPVPVTVYAGWSAPCEPADFAADFNGAGNDSTVALCADVTIVASDDLPLTVASGTAITLDLNGHTLDVTGPDDRAGVGVPEGAALTITDSSSQGSGVLIAVGGYASAGIGGDDASRTPGSIIINAGNITADGGESGAGIGGGVNGDGGNITINGGTVTATGQAECDREMFDLCSGAGIGGAGNGGVGTITINGGIVAATGNGMSAGIGGGGASSGSNGGTITINGGDVTATGGNDIYSGAGIGSAGNRTAGPIIITGGTVHATGGHGASGDGAGAGIGSGAYAASATGNISISGGDITAAGGPDNSVGAAGIGGGSCSAAPVVAISGASTVVTAAGTAGGAGIGGGGCGSPDYGIDGGDVTIGTGVTATVGSESGNAIGGSNGGAFGSLHNAGILTLAGPLAIPTDATITNDGTLVVPISISNAGTITGTGTIGGVGTVDNAGAIWHTLTIDGELTVQDHHYQLSFDAAGGEIDWAGASAWDIVDGPTLTDVGRTTADFPEVTRSGYTFTGWFLGTGNAATLVTDTMPLPGSSSDGIPVALTLDAGWEISAPAHVSVAGGDGQTADAGSEFETSLSVSVTDAEDAPVADGTEVTFTVTQGEASFAGQASVTASTDERGVAIAPGLTAGSAAGTVTVEATVDGVTSPAVFTETVAAVLTVTTTDLPDAEVGVDYDQTLAATGAADGVYHWTLTEGTLPEGLHLSDDGVISGTPTSAGTFAFTVSLNDSTTAELTIVVTAAAAGTDGPTEPDPAERDPAETGGLAATGGAVDLLPAGAAAILLLLFGSLALTMASRARRIRHDW